MLNTSLLEPKCIFHMQNEKAFGCVVNLCYRFNKTEALHFWLSAFISWLGAFKAETKHDLALYHCLSCLVQRLFTL